MKLRGFTLIELIVVMGILAILATIVVIAVNPGRQFAASRNAKRASDVRALAQAVNQHAADNNGQVFASITTTPKTIGTTVGSNFVDLTATLVPNYLSAIPTDPSSGSAANTKYSIYIDATQKVVVNATVSENNQIVSSSGGTNYGIQLDGTNDYLVASTLTNVVSGATARTVEMWIKLTPTNVGGTIFGINSAGGGQKFYNQTNNGYVFTDGVNSPNNISQTSGNLVADTWYHYAFTFDGTSSWRFYINGTLRQSGTYAVAINTGTPTSISIGERLDASQGSTAFRGVIDEVRLSNTVRYPADFSPSRRLNPDANTVGLWHFDEAVGTTAFDSSGNNNHVTLTNGPTWVLGQ